MNWPIESVEITDVKSVSRVIALAPVQVIGGPVGSGKTTILNAVELALSGQVTDPHAPDKPVRRNQDIFRLARQGADAMSVGLRLRDLAVSRSWTRSDTPKGPSISAKLAFTGQSAGAAKATQAEAELAQKLRPSRLGLNIRLLPSMTDGERRKIMLDMLASRIGRDGRPLDEWLYEVASASRKLRPEDGIALERRLSEAIRGTRADDPVLDRLRTVESAAKEQAKKDRELLEGTERALAELGPTGGEIDTSRISVLKDGTAALLKATRETAGEIGAAESALKRREERGEIVAKLREIEATVECRGPRKVPVMAGWAGCPGDETCPQCHGNLLPDPGYIERLVAEMNRVITERTARLGEARKIEQGRRANAASTRARLEQKEQEIAEWKAKIDAAGKATGGRCVISDAITCPLDSGSIIAVLNRLLDEWEGEAAALRRDLEESEKAVSDAAAATSAAVEELHEAERERDHFKEYGRAAMTANDARRDRIEWERKITEEQVPDLDALRAKLRGDSDRRDTLANELEDLQAAQTRANAHSGLNLEREKRAQALRCAEAIAGAAGIRGLQGEILKESVAPLAEGVNEVLRAFDPGRTFEIELVDPRGNEACILGFRDTASGTSRTFEAASGGEQAILCLAIAVAMMRLEAVNLRVLLIDNIEALDDLEPMASGLTPRRALLQAVLAAVRAGWIDSAILAGAIDVAPLADAAGTGEKEIGWTDLRT